MLSRFSQTKKISNGTRVPVASRFAQAGEPEVVPAKADPYGPASAPAPSPARLADGQRAFLDAKMRLHQKLLEVLNLSALEKMNADEFRRETTKLVSELAAQEKLVLNADEQARLIPDIMDELLGLGPIEPLLKDPTVNDILINTHQSIWVERAGKLEPSSARFQDERHLLRILNKIVAGVGRRVDEATPLVDARLPDGSRVNAVIPPIAVDGALVSIRKFSKQPYTMERLVEIGSLTQEMAEILAAVVRGKLNILVSGGTGSGKTTMLNAMSRFIDHRDRIVTVEDAAELQLQQPHVCRLETRPPNLEGGGEIAQRHLVKNALRMRPDRIIIGECRGGEAFDMLQAMNTGHEGSLTTIHANTCRDALGRVEQMIGMAGMDLPLKTIRQQIASALDIVIQLERLSDGRRRLTSVHEVTGMEGDTITMQEIFYFKREFTETDGTIRGRYWATGIRPRFTDDLRSKGIMLEEELFAPDQPLGGRTVQMREGLRP